MSVFPFSVFPLSAAVFFGYEFFSLLLWNKANRATCLAVGATVGIIGNAWVYFIASVKYELNLKHGIINTSIFTIIGLILLIIKKFISNFGVRKQDKRISNIALLFSVILPSFFFGCFLWTGLFGNGIRCKGSAYGDFPFHMNLIMSFVYGCNKNRSSVFDIVSPFYSSEKLAYPIIPNFYSAVLISCFGTSLHEAVFAPSIIFTISIFIILKEICMKFCESELPCCIAPWIFLFTGGLGFLQYFDEEARNCFYTDYVHQWSMTQNEFWFQTIHDILLPQRASLFSLPLAWSVILLLMSFNGERNIRVFFATGLVVASISQVQAHSIIALLEWGCLFAAITFPFKNRKKWSIWIFNYLALGVTAIIIGVPQFLPFFGRTKSGFWKVAPLYIEEHLNDGFLYMWWKALGAFIVLSLIHVPLSLTKRQMSYYIPSMFVFFVSNFVQYQPWSLDNTKVFNAAFIPLCCVGISYFLTKISEFGVFGTLTSIGLFCYCVASGVLSANKCWHDNGNLWGINEAPFIIAEWVRNRTDPKGVWLTDQGHTNPIVCLAGRQNFLGYKGWLLSHNIDFSERINIIKRLAVNAEDTDDIDRFNVTYVGVRSNIDSNSIVDMFVFQPNLTNGKWKQIYKSSIFNAYQRVK
jgi:hypothetical protein